MANVNKQLGRTDFTPLDQNKLQKLYDSDYIPQSEDKNSVYFYVREPHISINMQNNLKQVGDYMKYLKCLEGVSKNIKLQSFGFDSFFILDGFFEVPVSYHEVFEVTASEKKLRTIYKY